MTTLNPHKWKTIIGPEYDAMVKSFLTFIKELKNDTEKSNLPLPRKLHERLLATDKKQSFIHEDGVRNLMNDDDVMAEFPHIAEVNRVFHNFEYRRKHETESLQQDLITLAHKLPAPSSAFFIHELTTLPKKFSHEKDLVKAAKRPIALLNALMFQCIFQDFDRCHEENNINLNLLDSTSFLRIFALQINSLLAQIAFQNTIQELLTNGDDESLFKAVRIDKNILCTDIFQDRIAKAQLSGDMQFFKKLGNNISYNPLAREAMYYEAYLVLRTFWLAGLNLLKPKDMDDFLTCCGIPHQPNPESLKRFIERHIHPIYGVS